MWARLSSLLECPRSQTFGDTRRRALRAAAWQIDLLFSQIQSYSRDLAWRAIDPRHPGITSEESQACPESAEFQAVLAVRGIHDMSLVVIDAESMGGFEPA